MRQHGIGVRTWDTWIILVRTFAYFASASVPLHTGSQHYQENAKGLSTISTKY